MPHHARGMHRVWLYTGLFLLAVGGLFAAILYWLGFGADLRF